MTLTRRSHTVRALDSEIRFWERRKRRSGGAEYLAAWAVIETLQAARERQLSRKLRMGPE